MSSRALQGESALAMMSIQQSTFFFAGVKKQPLGLHPLFLLRPHRRVRVGSPHGVVQHHQ